MNIGNLFLTLALPVSIYSIFTLIFGLKNPKLIQNGRRALHLVTILVSISSIMLVFAFVTDSFELEYVSAYSSRALPLIYKFAGIWAGLDGSLLFWVWLIVIYSSINAIRNKGREFPVTDATIQIVAAFFLVMLIFEANPFKAVLPAPADGSGLNPLLQNYFMIFHPPALYLGYVGFTIPFAYAIAALISSDSLQDRDSWVRDVRFWTVMSWLFLTIGNILGAMWAYVELGWGGFWAWDPVENAGILPWFTATAFLHSIIVQEKRGMFRLWNLALVILTFLLTIFGTFITRSGVIKSVHSFSDITIGTYFIIFLVVAVLVSAYLFAKNYRSLRSTRGIESVFSRESAFCLNNILFIFALIAVFVGTVFPLLTELFMGQKLEVGPPFFNRVMAPIGILILFLTGIGPELSWGKLGKGIIKREFLLPGIFAIVALIVAALFGVRKWFPLAVSAGSVFVFITIIDEFIRASRVNHGFFSLFRRAPRRYGGYIVHLGVVFLFIGIAGSAYQEEFDLSIIKGEKESASNYTLELNSINWVHKADIEGVVTTVKVYDGEKLIGNLRPSLFLHNNQPKPIAEVDLDIKPFKDIYLALAGVSSSDNRADFKFYINPLISWVWLGGLIMILGAILALISPKRKDYENELDAELGRAAKGDLNASSHSRACPPAVWRESGNPVKTFKCILILIIAFTGILASTHLSAQPTPDSPHQAPGGNTGTITGRLLGADGLPVKRHLVTLNILRRGNVILTIPKWTDDQGLYNFKNIFQSLDFSYGISAEYKGQTYRSELISLKPGEESRKLDLFIGGEEVAVHKHEKSTSEYKFLAIILSIAAIGYALYQKRRYKNLP